MPKKAGSVVINLSAGTAQFVADMERAKGKVVDFGAASQRMGDSLGHSVSQVQATSGALRVLEGGLNNNLRAAERFTANVLGLGPLLQKAFPVIGAIAFTGLLVKMGEEAYKLFQSISAAPEKMRGAFGGLNASLRSTNDGLELANARLDQDIAKLEGKRQNTLAIALLEAKKAADDLADSLDRDLSALGKVLDENKADVWQRLFGRISDAGLREKIGGASGFGGFRADVRDETERGRVAIDAAAAKNDQKGVDAAIANLKQKLQKRYQDLLAYLDAEIAKQQKVVSAGNSDFGSGEGSAAAYAGAAAAAKKAAEFAEELQFVRSNIAEESSGIGLRVGNYQRTERKTGLEGDAANAKLDRPFEDRMKMLGAELDGVKAKLAAVGQGAEGEAIAKSFMAAAKAIEEVNKAREHMKEGPLDKHQEGSIKVVELTIAQTEAETAYKTKVVDTTASLDERIAAQKALTDAIGKGYEATKRASVEASAAAFLGPNYNNASWLMRNDQQSGKSNAELADGVRQKYAAEYDAKHEESVKTAIQALDEQIDLERSLAKVQTDGAEAVRQATLAWEIRQAVLKGASEEQIKYMRDLYDAQRENTSAENIAKLKEEGAAMERIATAAREGAEAMRRATLENKYADMHSAGAKPGDISAQRAHDEAANEARIFEEAQKQAHAYSDMLYSLEERKEAIEKIQEADGQTLQTEIALRDIENQRLKILSDMALAQGRAQDGFKAFMIQMQQQAKQPAAIMEEAFTSALDKISDNFAKLLTGQKTAWAKMFQSIGEQMVKESIKSGLHTLLGKAAGAIHPTGKPITNGNGGLLGTGQVPKLGPDMPGFGMPDGTASNPFYVVSNGASGPNPSDAIPGVKPPTPQQQKPNPWLTILGSALGAFAGASLGAGGGSKTPDVHSTISYPGFADGTESTPAGAYWVGEDGPELMSGAGRQIASNAQSRRMLDSGSPAAFYHIDARGADAAQVEDRVKRSLIAVHGSAVSTSVQTVNDQKRRVPRRG